MSIEFGWKTYEHPVLIELVLFELFPKDAFYIFHMKVGKFVFSLAVEL